MDQYDAIREAVMAVDAVLRELARAIATAVARLGRSADDPISTAAAREGRRVVLRLTREVYGTTRTTATGGALYRTIVQTEELAAFEAFRTRMDALDRALTDHDAKRWQQVKAAMRAHTGDDVFANVLFEMHTPFDIEVRRQLGFLVDPNRRWVDPNGYRLSDRVWQQGVRVRNDIDKRIRIGLRRGESPLTIADHIEKYLNPDYAPLRFERNGRIVRRNVTTSPRGAGRGSTFARRLARTEVQHAYHESTRMFVQSIDVPGAGMRWALSPSHPRIDICDSLARQSSQGYPPGVYRPEDFPFVPHPQCLPGDTRVSGPAITDTFDRRYTGEMIEISVVTGSSLSITPNHPILTPKGWVPAGLLDEGDEIILDGVGERAVSVGVPDDVHREPEIQQVVESFSRSLGVSTESVPSSAEQFHGDGIVDENVDVVWSYGGLGANRDVMTIQPVGHESFRRGNAQLALLSRLGDPRSVLVGLALPTNSVVGTHGHVDPFFGRHEGETSPLGVWPPDDLNASILEHPGDDRSAGVESLGEPVDGPSLTVHVGDETGLRVDVISSVVRRHFSGHVYNLQTSEGWYTANGIIVHNCLCSAQPVMPSPEAVLDALWDRYLR